jgi:hypothetical protein
MCPGSNIVFLNILPRKEWRYFTNRREMDDIHKRLNRGTRSYLLQHNGGYIHHDDLDDCHDALYVHDGVHLSFFYERTFLLTDYRELLNSSF